MNFTRRRGTTIALCLKGYARQAAVHSTFICIDRNRQYYSTNLVLLLQHSCTVTAQIKIFPNLPVRVPFCFCHPIEIRPGLAACQKPKPNHQTVVVLFSTAACNTQTQLLAAGSWPPATPATDLIPCSFSFFS